MKALPKEFADELDRISKAITKLSNTKIPTHTPYLVDVGARLSILKRELDEQEKTYKEIIWEKNKGKTGEVSGVGFIAELSSFPVTRFDTKLFKIEKPGLYKKYLSTPLQFRLTFKPRG